MTGLDLAVLECVGRAVADVEFEVCVVELDVGWEALSDELHAAVQVNKAKSNVMRSLGVNDEHRW
jgi:hypothetical protein